MKFGFFLLLILHAWLATAQSSYIHKNSGVFISFVTDDEMFPESWRGGEINGHATSMNVSEYKRTKKIIHKALSKYPPNVLLNLKKIYFLNSLDFYGVNYGGTNSTDVIYLTNQGVKNNYTDLYLEQIIHEEFSSILLRNYGFNISESIWTNCASDSISYSGTGAAAIKNGKASEEFQAELNQEGFLGEYATSNFENDLNSFAKNLFCPKANFWELVERYPRLKCKLELILAFYFKINEKMDESYFKKWK